MRKEREILHRRAENRTSRSRVQPIVLAIRMRRKDHLATEILVEVISSATDRSDINGGVVDARRLQLPMCPEIRISRKHIEPRRVNAHGSGGAGGLRTQTCYSKADCACSQYEPANTTK